MLKVIFKDTPTFDDLKIGKVKLEDCVESISKAKVRKSNVEQQSLLYQLLKQNQPALPVYLFVYTQVSC